MQTNMRCQLEWKNSKKKMIKKFKIIAINLFLATTLIISIENFSFVFLLLDTFGFNIYTLAPVFLSFITGCMVCFLFLTASLKNQEEIIKKIKILFFSLFSWIFLFR